ncbi:MAG: DUF4139 domain-containing protein [Armatimonadota bacterium]
MKRLLTIIAVLTVITTAATAQTVSGPKEVQLTVYNGNFALVKDTRTVTLNQGTNSIEVEDVAALIDPTSILIRSLSNSGSFSILEQNYQYDLINPENILNKSVGQRVTFTIFDESGKQYTQSGILLSPVSNGGVVIKTDDGNVVLSPQGQVSLVKMPEGLRPRPTLNWLLRSSKSGSQQAEISYMTDGIGWKADYVVLVNKNDTALDLNGWVTLNNQCGTTYNDAKLTLMAGDVKRAQDKIYGAAKKRAYSPAQVLTEAETAPQFEEKSFFEYHMYTMERPTTIRNNETKQLSLLNAANTKVTKELIYDPQDNTNYHKINVVLQLMNSKENNMGMPLPAGKIRVYKLDDQGAQQFIGEDMIDHTPKDEKIRLNIGDAFDVVGDNKRTDYQKISDNVVEESFEVTVRNHKDSPVEVNVIEHAYSTWRVVKSSSGYNKKDAQTIVFPVKVPANGETTITYTIRTSW